MPQSIAAVTEIKNMINTVSMWLDCTFVEEFHLKPIQAIAYP